VGHVRGKDQAGVIPTNSQQSLFDAKHDREPPPLETRGSSLVGHKIKGTPVMPRHSFRSALDENRFAFRALRMKSMPIIAGYSLCSALGDSRFAFCPLFIRSLFF
jgi:hypothetical protein